MKMGVLFSGGKDSTFAVYLAKEKGHEIKCLISILSENEDSYMFQCVKEKVITNISKRMGIPVLFQKTKGEKEKELMDLKKVIKKAKEKYSLEGIVTGAMESVYQASRIQKICNELNLECFNPLWKKDPEEYWEELIKNKFRIKIVKVAADGLTDEWVGKEINRENLEKLKKLSKKYKFHLGFEGGEAETEILDCPLFKKAF